MLCKSYQVHLLCGPMPTPWRWGILLFLLLPLTISQRSFSGGSDGKESACQCRRHRFDPWVGKIPQRREGLPTLVYSCLENSMDRRAWWAIHSMGSQRVGHDLAAITHTISQIFLLAWDSKYLQIFVIHLLSSAFLFPAVWAIVPPGSLLILHSFNTLLLHMVSVTGMVPSPGDTETSKTIYHWRKEKHFEISFFLRFILFFWGLIMSVTFVRIVSLNLDSHAHNDFYANFPSPPLFLLIKL